MVYQKLFNNKYCRVGRIILASIAGVILFSCSPQIKVTRFNSYPPRGDEEPVAIYKKKHEIPGDSKAIGKIEIICNNAMKACDSVFAFSLAETKVNRIGGNALLVNEYKNATSWHNLSLIGDIFLVHDFSSPPYPSPDTLKKMDFLEKYMYAGFGVGPETGISLLMPKFSYYNFQNRKYFETYYGIEGSAWIIHALFMSLDCLYGVKKDKFTFDSSIGIWWYPKLKNEDGSEGLGPYFHTTLNPKIGFKFRNLWLKAGPSIHLYKDYPKEQEKLGIVDFVKIGKIYYNFEILIKM